MNYAYIKKDDYLMHYGVKGMKWRNRKNRPLSREERVTEGNGHASIHGNGLLIDYGEDDKVGDMPGSMLDMKRPKYTTSKKRPNRPQSREEYRRPGAGKVFKQTNPIKTQFGNSAGVRKRKKIYGYKRKQRMGLIRTM